MPKEIILYNLKKDVSEEDYVKWCEDFKGPLLLGLSASKNFTLLKMIGGMAGNPPNGQPPGPTQSPYKFIGILEISSLEEWKKDTESKSFREEFFPQWVQNWVADFYVLGGVEVYSGKSQ